MSEQAVNIVVDGQEVEILKDIKAFQHAEYIHKEATEIILEDIEKEVRLLNTSPATESETEIVRTLLQEAGERIAQRFKEHTNVREMMIQKKSLEHTMFDICQRLEVKIPLRTVLDDGKEKIEFLEFNNSPNDYNIEQLCLGLLYAAISIEDIRNENKRLNKDLLSANDKIHVFKKDISYVNEKNAALESEVIELRKVPKYNILGYDKQFSLFNPTTDKWLYIEEGVAIEDVKPNNIKASSKQEKATNFNSKEQAEELLNNMISYRKKLKKKFKGEYKSNTKLRIKNPHKFIITQLVLMEV